MKNKIKINGIIKEVMDLYGDIKGKDQKDARMP